MQILRIVYIHVLERLQTLFLSHSLPKSKQKNGFQIFAQNNGLTPLEKWKICDFLNSVFLLSKKASCLSRTSPNTFNNPNLPKRKRWRNFKFLPETMDQLVWKNGKFTTFLNRFLLWSRQASFLSRTSKSLFLGKVCLKRNFGKMQMLTLF